LVNGNPLENIQVVADPDKNFVIIMKDGVIYKNTLALVKTDRPTAAIRRSGGYSPSSTNSGRIMRLVIGH